MKILILILPSSQQMYNTTEIEETISPRSTHDSETTLPQSLGTTGGYVPSGLESTGGYETGTLGSTGGYLPSGLDTGNSKRLVDLCGETYSLCVPWITLTTLAVFRVLTDSSFT